jgi:membrane peptidoglycan carboxypeptidase
MKLSKRGSETSTYRTRLRPRLYQRRWFQLMFGGAFVLGIIGLVVVFLFLKPRREKAYAFDLAEVNNLEIPSRIYDRHGKEIGLIKVQDRRPVDLDKVPYHLIQALTAVEDSRFFEHDGVDYIGVVRAVVLNFKAGRVTQGASTITQQLAKQTYEDLRLNRTLDNKIIEAFLARRFEQNYTKSEILEHYLNRVFFGSGYFGIEAAARGYFGKSVSEIDVVEAATLCGLIKSPTRLSPKNNPGESRTARNHVLGRMHTEDMITAAELAEYRARPIELAPANAQQNSYVNEIIRLRVIEELGFERAATGGFKIHTTIDRDVQSAARQSLRRNLTKAEGHANYKHRTYAQYQETAHLPDPLSDVKPATPK